MMDADGQGRLLTAAKIEAACLFLGVCRQEGIIEVLEEDTWKQSTF